MGSLEVLRKANAIQVTEIRLENLVFVYVQA